MTHHLTHIVLTISAIALISVSGIGNGLANAQEELPLGKELKIPQQENPGLVPKQDPEIDTRVTSWNEAGQAGRPGDRIRANWVMVSELGELAGSVTAASADMVPLNIYALQRGFVTSETKTDRSGNFRLEGLTKGAYTIVGYSPAAFFAYGVNVVEFRAGATHLPRRISTQAINYTDKLLVGKLIQDSAPGVEFRSYGDYPVAEDDVSRAAWFGWQGLAAFDIESTPATTIQSRAINLQSNGLLRGRIHQINHLNGRPVPVKKTKVMLVEQGRVVAEAACNRLGVFEISGLSAGEFGLVVTGSDGFAAMGIQLIDSHRSRVSRREGQAKTRLVTTTTQQSQTEVALDLTLVQPDSTGWINHHLGEQQFAEALARPRARPQNPVCCGVCAMPIYGPGPRCGCRH